MLYSIMLACSRSDLSARLHELIFAAEGEVDLEEISLLLAMASSLGDVSGS